MRDDEHGSAGRRVRDIAEQAGLVHRPADRPGIGRRRRGPWTAKDLRTFGGTTVVVETLASFTARLTDEDDDALVRDAIAAAADALGNTAAVCRSSYVAPDVIESFTDGRLARCWRQSRRSKWLSRAERTTDRLLSGP